jgi:hypothetical protein
MDDVLFARLAPVRRRQQGLRYVRAASLGLLVSSLAAIAAAMVSWFTNRPMQIWQVAALIAAGPLVASLIAAWRRSTWHAAAAAIDEACGLKDRATTAVEFVTHRERTPLEALQIADALEHLASVPLQTVVAWRMPRVLPLALGSLVLALALWLWPAGPAVSEARMAPPPPAVIEVSEQIADDLHELEAIARQEHDPELQALVGQLQEQAAAMQRPGVDLRAALATLSEMQAAIQAQQAQYNVAAADAQLQSLGAALGSAQALQPAGQALNEGKYAQAAADLERLNDLQLGRNEAQALKEKLRQAASDMSQAGLASLSKTVSEMSESTGDCQKCQQCARCLAKEISQHAARRRINDLLQCQSCRLCECKGNCQKDSYARGKKPSKSNRSSTNFGMATSGNLDGEASRLLAGRKLEQLKGQSGEGPSETETSHSPEGHAEAQRQYRDVYKKYQRLSEAVLDSEPIPLGNRHMIRRYFESIRPSQADAAATDTAVPETK